jgi:hypothetical protein
MLVILIYTPGFPSDRMAVLGSNPRLDLANLLLTAAPHTQILRFFLRYKKPQTCWAVVSCEPIRTDANPSPNETKT